MWLIGLSRQKNNLWRKSTKRMTKRGNNFWPCGRKKMPPSFMMSVSVRTPTPCNDVSLSLGGEVWTHLCTYGSWEWWRSRFSCSNESLFILRMIMTFKLTITIKSDGEPFSRNVSLCNSTFCSFPETRAYLRFDSIYGNFNTLQRVPYVMITFSWSFLSCCIIE